MKRILICLLVLFIGIVVSLPQPAGSDPRRQEYDVPGEYSNSGDDDVPNKTALGTGSITVGRPAERARTVASPGPSGAQEASTKRTPHHRLVGFIERLRGVSNRLSIKSLQ